MKYYEFVSTVRDRASNPSRDEAGRVAGAVLEVLAGRITPGEVGDLAAQLPDPLAEAVRRGRREQPGPTECRTFAGE